MSSSNSGENREQKAKTFLGKSNESLSSAKICLENNQLRGTCNRSYYAVFQILNASTYLHSDHTPQDFDKRARGDAFGHTICKFMLQRLQQAVSQEKIPSSDLVAKEKIINNLREFREYADYSCDESEISAQAAKAKLTSADKFCSWVKQFLAGIE